MRKIAETNVLIRTRIELPGGVSMATEDFREGWSLTRSAGARRLQKRIQKHGWSLVGNSVGLERSGVGPTAQHAIVAALTLALRRTSAHVNVVELEHIQLTQYPWFFLARVITHPYRIQESASLPVCDDAVPLPARARQSLAPLDTAAQHPLFASAMPQLKEMLILA
jgi:hypothetical protein